MSSGSKPALNFGTESALNGTISELISLLRSAFQPTDFDKVQQILITREENMKRTLGEMSTEIENGKKECDLMEKKHGELALTKLEIEYEFSKCKQECDELREQLARFNEDQRVHRDRARRAEERYAKLLEDFTKAENDKREVILQLKVKSTDLECVNAAKRRAEGEVEAWKKKFGELELRVLRLEEDTTMLANGDTLFQKKIEEDLGALDEDLGAEQLVSNELRGEKETSDNGKSQNETGVGNGSPNSAHPLTKESVSNFHEKVDTMTGAGFACDPPVIQSNGLQAAGSHSINRACDNGRPAREHLAFEVGSCNKVMGSSREGDGRPQSGVVIEINDSDDEMPTVHGTACASGVSLSEKETTSQTFVKGAHSGQASEENGRSCMENCLLGSISKRKRAFCTNVCESEDDEVDDKTRIGMHKMKQMQELIHDPKISPVNVCSATPDSGGTAVAKAVSPSRQSPMLLQRCKEKIDSSDSEDSSASSGDERYTDSYMNNMIANLRGKRGDKIWVFEMDMLLAFERDPELCMNAVCALYRHQSSTDKSIKGNLLSQNRGFNQFNALRGTTLAKFLIDGDPQGKLKKSISELQQHDPKGLDDCRKLATQHSRQLFEIYQNKKDPFFFPS